MAEDESIRAYAARVFPNSEQRWASSVDILEEKLLYVTRDLDTFTVDELKRWDIVPGLIARLKSDGLLAAKPASSSSGRFKRITYIPKVLPQADGKLGLRVSRLERNSQCIGTAIRVTDTGIILTNILDNEQKQHLNEIHAFGEPVSMLVEHPFFDFCFLQGKAGESFYLAGIHKVGPEQEVQLISYPRKGRGNQFTTIEGIVKKVEGVTGTQRRVKYEESIENISGGAITIGEKLLEGIHIGSADDDDDVENGFLGKYLPAHVIRFYLGEFDTRYHDPLDVAPIYHRR